MHYHWDACEDGCPEQYDIKTQSTSQSALLSCCIVFEAIQNSSLFFIGTFAFAKGDKILTAFCIQRLKNQRNVVNAGG